ETVKFRGRWQLGLLRLPTGPSVRFPPTSGHFGRPCRPTAVDKGLASSFDGHRIVAACAPFACNGIQNAIISGVHDKRRQTNELTIIQKHGNIKLPYLVDRRPTTSDRRPI